MLHRPQVSPGRTPSPMEYNSYNPHLIQPQLSPQFQSTNSHVVQQPTTGTHIQQPFPYNIHDTLQTQPQGQLILNRVTSGYQELQTLDNAGNN